MDVILLLFLVAVLIFHWIYGSLVKRKIYAAGSGEDMFSLPETAIEVIELSEKQFPTILYIGTATYDDDKSQHTQTKEFSKRGCQITALKVAKRKPSHEELDAKFSKADIIIISGGNTLYAIDRWKRLGIDERIRQAGDEGKVLAGGSAGGIVWFDGGHSDSMDPTTYIKPPGPFIRESLSKKELDKSWAYIRVPGLSILPGLFCPHYDKTEGNGELRAKNFRKMLQMHSGERGIAIDNWAAFVVDGNNYRVISRKGKGGSVGKNGEYTSDDKTGRPGGFILEIDEQGRQQRRLMPESGSIHDVLREPQYVTPSNMLSVARLQNPLVEGFDNGGKPNQVALASTTNQTKGSLFFYLESPGFDVPELKMHDSSGTLGLDPKVIFDNFSECIVIANASHSMKISAGIPRITAVEEQWNNQKVKKLCSDASGVVQIPIRGWVSFYLSEPYGAPLPSGGTTTYKLGIAAINELFPKSNDKYTNPHDISGIMFDNEGVQHIHAVVDLFENIKNDTGTKIGWTLAPGSAKNCGPKDLNKCNPSWTSTNKVGVCIDDGVSVKPATHGINKIPWDICLAQLYTEGEPLTKWFFDEAAKNGCATFSSDFWTGVAKAFGCPNITTCGTLLPPPDGLPCEGLTSRAVPMVCGSGNCQETVGKTTCYDERMSGKSISDLIDERGDTLFRNFAIWYGTNMQAFCDLCRKKKTQESCIASPGDGCEWSNDTSKCSFDATTTDWGCAKSW